MKKAYSIFCQLSAGDQPGLLSRIARVLVQFGVNVHSARINTMGDRAEDTFLVTGEILSQAKTLIHPGNKAVSGGADLKRNSE